MKIIYTGLESNGKSLKLADKVLFLVRRNKRWFRKYGFLRKIYSNLKFNEVFYKKNSDFISYWEDMREVVGLTGCDIIWDEISSDFSALKKEPMPRKINRWLRQGAKQGVHIYATAQEFHDVHLDFRRRVSECINFTKIKILSSPRGGENLPPVKWIYGLCLGWEYEIHPYNELQPQRASFFPEFIFITRGLCNIFDTHQVILSSNEPPYEHAERFCEKYGKGCSFKKTIHR